MSDPPDHILVRRAAGGDDGAFSTLLGRYRRQLLALMRRELDDASDIEDVWQETLLSSWRGLRAQAEIRHPFAWLCQVARHRCRDQQRSSMAAERSIRGAELAGRLHRTGRVRARPSETAEELAAMLKVAPGAEMQTARLFYLDQMSIAEVAAEQQMPVGTVKRRLFAARRQLRQLSAAQNTRGQPMPPAARKRAGHRFPKALPPITITPSRAKPFAVDCREIAFVVPEVGQVASWASYDSPVDVLTEVTEVRAARGAEVHGQPCIEIEMRDWTPADGWQPSLHTFYARLTEATTQFLAVVSLDESGRRRMRTYLDEDFDEDWHEAPRIIKDTGQLVCGKDGAFERRPRSERTVGSGVFNLCIGLHRFRCLRVFDIGTSPHYHPKLIESYLTAAGRTIYQRQFTIQAGLGHTVPPDVEPVVFDGIEFYLWYQVLTGAAIGRTPA